MEGALATLSPGLVTPRQGCACSDPTSAHRHQPAPGDVSGPPSAVRALPQPGRPRVLSAGPGATLREGGNVCPPPLPLVCPSKSSRGDLFLASAHGACGVPAGPGDVIRLARSWAQHKSTDPKVASPEAGWSQGHDLVPGKTRARVPLAGSHVEVTRYRQRSPWVS